jgi:glycosyltransferase involved in cell wall biosynthesis
MQSPLISVVIPTYNRATLLSRAIRSVLAQSLQQFELLIVDDNSPDDTAAAVNAFGDERIRYIRHDRNRGSSGARNSGIRNARTEYVAFLDDDDEYLPHTLSETYEAFQRLPESVGYVIGGICVVKDSAQGEEVLGEHFPPACNFAGREQNYLAFLRQIPFATSNGVTFRRSAFDTAGFFDEQLRAAVDRDIFIRFARYFDYFTIRKILVRVHKHVGAQLTDLSPKRVVAYEMIAEKHKEALRRHPKYYGDVLFTIGLKYYRCGEKVKGRRAFGQSIAKSPFQPKVFLNFLSFELFGMDSFQLRQQLHRTLGSFRKFTQSSKHEIVSSK